jgi:diguanylate cyclase (GGDEF)-like protein
MRILLVEDAKSVVQVMTARLASYGHEVVHAENGKVAVDQFEAAAPDLVLMDIEMPVMNGFEASHRIRELEAQRQWAWTPIIFLTSSDTVENLVTAIEAGGDDFMSKFAPEPVLKAKMKAMARIAALRHSLSIANKKLQTLADQDGLTGLANRRSMDRRVDALWLDAMSSASAFSILMIDIDNFKKFNDHYGHQAGDECLRQVAAALDGAVAQANTCRLTSNAFTARYGGEEFAVVIPDASEESVQALAQILVDAVRALSIPHQLNADWGKVTISVGGARLEKPEGMVNMVFRLADSRLYRAKSEGRNCAVTI